MLLGTPDPATLELPVTGVLTEIPATRDTRLMEGLTLSKRLIDLLGLFTEFL